VAVERQNPGLFAAVEIRKGASLDMHGKHVGDFINTVRPEISDTALYNGVVLVIRLPEANFGRSERITVIEKRPFASTIMLPFGLGP
jgi:hypothetical protein